MTTSSLPPTRIPDIAFSKPGITPPSGKLTGPVAHDDWNTFPVV